ncbi:tyrosine-type recombinase/integrase [Nitrosopumilus sp. K4]|uniref:tyrosine-type recombinase/integrase n=1 Tax=Nitrosopumilus sp. K4 TaxID=2795383 RepID=UPI001BA63E29|nr:tyrosine-type recombinase/integrase [Nitrosopumilus sp. K4]QUC65417.1 tyrosine-type recombinase/integrase [Nitrosopumilus sp. K4]
MIKQAQSPMEEQLTFEEFIATRPKSVQKLARTTMRILNIFTNITYSKSFDKIVKECPKETINEHLIMILKKFSIWCQQDHPEIKYHVVYGKTLSHKKKSSRTISAYTSIIRAVLEGVYGIELYARNFKKKLCIPEPNDFDPEPFTKDEVRILCDYARTKHKLHYMVLKDSGLRVGESVAIRKKHIDTTKNPIEILVPANITKTKKTRTTYVTRETAPMLIGRLNQIGDDDLVFGTNDDQMTATVNAENYYWYLRDKIKQDYPVFDEKYQENGRYKKNLHSLRAYTATQCAEAIDESFGHGIIGHKKYLQQYIRNQDKMSEKYKRAENHLMIYETVEVLDNDEKIGYLESQMKELFKLLSMKEERTEKIRMIEQRLSHL